MRSACKTDTGLQRENNEDYLLADEENGIFLLADGMGGGPGGEVASELAVRAAHDLLLSQPAAGAGEGAGRMLADALAAAHSAVAKRAIKEPTLRGMGCTLEILLVRGSEAVICHVGDSRVYLLRERLLRQLTNDDNYAAWFARAHDIPPEKVPAGYRHVLTQAVGVSDELIPELLTLRCRPGDVILVCSDGLNGVVRDREILEILLENRRDLLAAAGALVAAALEKGGPDNVSVLLVEPEPVLQGEPLLLAR